MAKKGKPKRQKTLMKKRQKDNLRKKQMQQKSTSLSSLGYALASTGTKIRHLARACPIQQCLINEGWQEGGLAIVTVARSHPRGLMVGVYLVDVFCLGLKNTYCVSDLSPLRYKELIEGAYRGQEAVSCSMELAHEIVYGAIEYAAGLGFQPQRDFRESRYILEPRDKVQLTGKVRFGKDGKPLYISGPSDDSRQIIRKLHARLGPGGYDYIAEVRSFENEIEEAAETAREFGGRVLKLWDVDEIEAMPTEKIIDILAGFGIAFDCEQFLADVQRHVDSSAIAEEWQGRFDVNAKDADEDFSWMAAGVLWKRLAPEVLNTDMVCDILEESYSLLAEGDAAKVCRMWLDLWDRLKERIGPDGRSIADVDEQWEGCDHYLSNWCQDVAVELGEAGRNDPQLHREQIRYCREFRERLPESDPLILQNMWRAEAESHYHLGEEAEGEKLLKAFVERWPDDAWGYISWGDMYFLDRRHEAVPLDRDKAERIYRMGLERGLEEPQPLLDRIEELKRTADRPRQPAG